MGGARLIVFSSVDTSYHSWIVSNRRWPDRSRWSMDRWFYLKAGNQAWCTRFESHIFTRFLCCAQFHLVSPLSVALNVASRATCLPPMFFHHCYNRELREGYLVLRGILFHGYFVSFVVRCCLVERIRDTIPIFIFEVLVNWKTSRIFKK